MNRRDRDQTSSSRDVPLSRAMTEPMDVTMDLRTIIAAKSGKSPAEVSRAEVIEHMREFYRSNSER